MAELYLNIDLVASARNLCGGDHPAPCPVAVLAELAGIDGICAHLRSDRKGLRKEDVRLLRGIVQTRLILKMKPSSEMVGFALDIKPDIVELVSERQKLPLVEEPLDPIIHRDSLSEIAETLQNAGIAACALISPDPEHVKLAHRLRVSMARVHTGRLFEATTRKKMDREMDAIVDCVKLSSRLGMKTFVGGGLNYDMINLFRGLSEIDAFQIGRAVVSRAILVGMDTAVRDMRRVVERI